MLREADEAITAAVDRLKAAFPKPLRGTFIVWADVERVMERGRYDRGGMTIIRKFRRWLLREHRIVTYPRTDVGLRLLSHREAAQEVPELRQRKARSQHARGLREIRAVDGSALGVRERAGLAAQERNIREQRRAATRSLRGLATFLRERDARPVVIPEPNVTPKPKPKYAPREGPPMLRPAT